MRSLETVPRSGVPASWALCLFAFCLTPFILDVATCDEVNAAPLHQPVLVDGEDIDPSKATAAPSSYHHDTSSPILLTRQTDDHKTAPTFDPLGPTRYLAICSLTSRPPPLS